MCVENRGGSLEYRVEFRWSNISGLGVDFEGKGAWRIVVGRQCDGREENGRINKRKDSSTRSSPRKSGKASDVVDG
jgi:hypothetical protein